MKQGSPPPQPWGPCVFWGMLSRLWVLGTSHWEPPVAGTVLHLREWGPADEEGPGAWAPGDLPLPPGDGCLLCEHCLPCVPWGRLLGCVPGKGEALRVWVPHSGLSAPPKGSHDSEQALHHVGRAVLLRRPHILPTRVRTAAPLTWGGASPSRALSPTHGLRRCPEHKTSWGPGSMAPPSPVGPSTEGSPAAHPRACAGVGGPRGRPVGSCGTAR